MQPVSWLFVTVEDMIGYAPLTGVVWDHTHTHADSYAQMPDMHHTCCTHSMWGYCTLSIEYVDANVIRVLLRVKGR